MDFEEHKDLAEWLEAGLQKLFELKPVSMALVAKTESGDTLTAYFHADAEQKAVFAHHIQTDIIMDVVLNNADMIRDALDELDGE